MKITFNAAGKLVNDMRAGCTRLVFDCLTGSVAGGIQTILRACVERRKKNAPALPLKVTLELTDRRRTFKQNAAVWVLVEAIFESLEGRKPSESEKYALYMDLLNEYADRIRSRVSGLLRPVHISESSAASAARFIDNLMYHIAKHADITIETQSSVRSVMEDWVRWRGGLEEDPLDLISHGEWRKRRVYSDASGLCGNIERCHIVSRGANAAAIDCPWNWLALTHEEHEEQHRRGWEAFLTPLPALARARGEGAA